MGAAQEVQSYVCLGDEAAPEVEGEVGWDRGEARDEVQFEDANRMLGGVCAVVVGRDEFDGEVLVPEQVLHGRRTFVVAAEARGADTAAGQVVNNLPVCGEESGSFAILEGVGEDEVGPGGVDHEDVSEAAAGGFWEGASQVGRQKGRVDGPYGDIGVARLRRGGCGGSGGARGTQV